MGFCFDWWILLLFIDIDKYYTMCYSKYDPKTFKNLVPFTIILQYALCAHK